MALTVIQNFEWRIAPPRQCQFKLWAKSLIISQGWNWVSLWIYTKSTDYEVNVLDQVQGVLNLSKELHNHMNDGLGFEIIINHFIFMKTGMSGSWYFRTISLKVLNPVSNPVWKTTRILLDTHHYFAYCHMVSQL